MPVAATIGFFDGVHVGHRSLLNRLQVVAKSRGLRSVAVTFRQHPTAVYAPERMPKLICSYRQRIDLLRQYADDVCVLDFDTDMAKMTAQCFAEEVLKKQLGVSVLIMGYNHRFGSDNLTDAEQYDALCRRCGIELVRAEEVEGVKVSSTMIRRLVAQNKFEDAARLLGYEYNFSGTVVHGNHIGTRLGFPTANISVDSQQLLPCGGVYAARVVTDKGEKLFAMMNIGVRPTICHEGGNQSVEVHILGLEAGEPMYGRTITVIPEHFIRNEIKFPSQEALKQQLNTDKTEIKKFFKLY